MLGSQVRIHSNAPLPYQAAVTDINSSEQQLTCCCCCHICCVFLNFVHLYIQSIVATAWQPISPMLVPPKKSSWIPQVSLTPYGAFFLLSSSSRMASFTDFTPSGPNRFPVKYSLVKAHPLLIPSANAMAPSSHM